MPLHSRRTVAAAAVSILAALAACDRARPAATSAVANRCTGCHGGLNDVTGAPPSDTAGRTSTAETSVGAHTTHLAAGVTCAACHRVPSVPRDAEVPEHQDGQVQVIFGGVALLGGGEAPTWDRATGTCSNVYCHGGKLLPFARGQTTTPTWTGLPPTIVPAGQPSGTPACGGCHGAFSSNGAPAGHGVGLAVTDCFHCHSGSVTAAGALRPASSGGLHLDGQVDFDSATCTGCHGDASRAESTARLTAAPPLDTAGQSSGAAVGAHLRHLSTVAGLGSRLSRPIGCDECHQVPTVIPHPAGAVVRFSGPLAPTGGLTPSYAGGTCSNVYCHGATLPGGTSKSPTWIQTYASAGSGPGGECGTCHFAANPPASHPQEDTLGAAITATTQCRQCHAGTVNADGSINVSLGLHVNGTVEVKPHAAGWVAATVHGPAAKADLAGCAASACHGADFAKDVGGGKSCNSCHANPADFGITGAARHAAWQNECTFCHGDANRAPAAGQDQVGTPRVNAVRAAPPLGSRDETSTSTSAVGAHLRHASDDAVAGNRYGTPIRCQECHGLSLPIDVAHVDGAITIGWQLAATGVIPTPGAGVLPRTGAGPALSCTNYCHGAAWTSDPAYAGAVPRPTWTGTLAAAAACGACHRAPPASPAHATVTASTSCSTCHAGYACTTGNLAACTVDKATHLNGRLDVLALACNTCHGSAANDAPPAATTTVNAAVKAGAHQAHLTRTTLRSAVLACADCHAVPSSATHASGTVDMAWGALARTGGVTPTPASLNAAAQATWEAAPTCANYCHGAGFAASVAGSATSPSWTGTGSVTTCASCHQAPPATAAHASVGSTTSCATCHAGYVCTTANLAACTVDKATHLNGVVDVPTLGCTSCHGSASNAAPPVATSTTNAAVKVGAHQAHLAKSNLRSAVLACADCHTVPSTTTHSSGTVDLTWSALARTGGLTPAPGSLNAAAQATWEAAPTCTNYCHGSGFTAAVKGSGATPSWTGAAVSAACGSCHQAPPATSGHATVTSTTNCGSCHTGYSCTTANLAACTVNKATHLNGTVEAPTLTCSTCHGSATNAAPPVATSTTNSAVKIGAHQAHLVKTNLRAAAIACADCHTVPTVGTHATGVVDLTWGALAKTGGLTPAPASLNAAAQATWEATPTCTNYCHGSGFTAAIQGAGATPSWTGAAIGTACGSCHKAPPATTAHVAVGPTTSCGNCHSGYVCTTANLAACTVNKATHLNGTVDTPTLTCSSCHGSATNAAPPVATSTTNSAVKIGAHQAHLTKVNLRTAALGCADCHAVPASMLHTNGSVDLPWGTLAKTGGLTPVPSSLSAAAQATWEATPTCTNYCHGAGFAAASRGTATAPSWTGTTAATTCGGCHAAPPATADHTSVTATTNCGSCHTGYSCTAANLAACTVNKTAHLNGIVDPPTLTCSSCHGSATNAAPPVATSTTNSTVKVGAHQAHLVKTNLRTAALACGDCHTVPSSTSHASGLVDMAWSALAAAGGVTPLPGTMSTAAQTSWEASPTCTNYCHGAAFAAASKGTGATPLWTGAAVNTACGACHAAPPATSDHTSVTTSTNCGSCHSGYSCTTANLAACTVNKTAHLNGVVDPPTLTCSSCHGSATNFAPPAATTTVNAAIKIGAHQAHLVKANLRTAALGCVDCHTVPTSTTHASGTVDLTWGTLAKTGGLTPVPASLGAAAQATWEASPTCTNYCHGAGFTAASRGTGATPSWTGAAVSTACGSCHAAPPATADHGSVTATTNCGSCHSGYSCTTANLAACTVNKTAHLNGIIDAPTLTCSSCHGSATNFAPPAATTTVNSAIKIGAHQAHLLKTNLRTAAIACTDCHAVPTSTTHASGLVDLTWGALAKTGGLTPLPATLGGAAQTTWEASPTCANYCHGAGFAAASKGNGATPLWTGAAVNTACGSCHAAPPATSDHSSVTASTNCGSCHSGYSCTTANLAACTVDKTAHLNGVVDPPTLTCSSCHGSATNFAPPSATTAVNSAVKIGAHQAHLVKTNLRATPVACGDCHIVPGSTTHSTGTVDLTWSALAKTGGLTPTPASLSAAAQATWEATPTCTNYCHGAGFAAASRGTGAVPSWTGAAVATACGDCHRAPPITADHGSVTTTTNCGGCHDGYNCTSGNLAACTVNKALHMDGTVQGSSESAGGTACGTCHATILQGMNGTTAKASKHLLGGDAAAVGALTWSNPLSGNAAASRTCTNMCHGDHPHDATSPAAATHEANVYSDAGTSASRTGTAGTRVVTGGAGTVNRARTDFEGTATNGGLCVSCHQNPVDAARPAVTKAGFTGAAHNFTTGWQFQLHSGTFDRNCTKCHASAAEGTTPLAAATGSGASAVHFGDNVSLLAGKLLPAGTAAGFVCYNCHGSTASPANGAQGNRSTKDVQGQIAHATTAGQSGHPANSDAVHDSVAELGAAAFGNTLGGKARHSGCMDCHDPHEAKAGTHAQGTNLAGPPLQGAWGAQLSSNPAAWTAPTAANFTKKAIVAGTDLEATLCFKCHSGFYGTLPTSPSGAYAETDQAKEFNPANAGFHAVVGSNSALVGNTGNLISPWARTSLMTCTDCHESDVVGDPNGPHGAASKFILKGPNTAWSATLVSTGASTWMPAGTFCLNCHNNTASSSRFTAHSRSDHKIACFNCHAAIPHGGPRPGMLVAGAGAAAAVGGTIAGWDTTSPYWRGTASNRLYLKTYPASNTAAWSQSNCGCNGTGH